MSNLNNHIFSRFCDRYGYKVTTLEPATPTKKVKPKRRKSDKLRKRLGSK